MPNGLVLSGLGASLSAAAVLHHRRTLFKMCSPAVRHARMPTGKYASPQSYISSSSQLMVTLRRPLSSGPLASNAGGGSAKVDGEEDFIEGAYMFHDVQQAGTLQPDSLCDTDHYGLSSPADGQVHGPNAEHLYWNVEGSLRCAHNFVPAANQSVTVTVSGPIGGPIDLIDLNRYRYRSIIDSNRFKSIPTLM